MIIFTG